MKSRSRENKTVCQIEFRAATSGQNALAVAKHIKYLQGKLDLSQRQLAFAIGFSQTYVSHHLFLLALPDFMQSAIATIYDYTLAYQVGNLYTKYPKRVKLWLENNENPSDKEFRIFIREAKQPGQVSRYLHDLTLFPYNIIATHNQSKVLLLQTPAPAQNKIWVRSIQSGRTFEVNIHVLGDMHLIPKT